MLRATRVIVPAHETAPASDDHHDTAERTVTLARDERYRRRRAMQTDCGVPFLLDLPEPAYLPHGACLALEGGGVIRVAAAAEPVLEIRAASSLELMKIAWHIGNRHVPAEITQDAIYIQPDHVLADMVRGLNGTAEEAVRPFEPEGGAYGHHGTLQAGHTHGAPAHSAGRDKHHHHDH